MQIKTEYEVGDKVWFLNRHAVKSGEIESIITTTINNRTNIKYVIPIPIDDYATIDEKDCYTTKQELISTL